ncbi:hypothetical protein [Glutamicibacter sp.]|uniref:hypothetical protein n=1 Tax=Glutamicibacter sp. TaxID=1931995 RepID=UPI0028BD4098|nr:hypothetical protein [Glutamicibacter sp.]
MSQPIDVGSVLSGRYQVTETVLSSAEGDLVLSGIDQVLNRSVSIMVASVANSSQLATSAREIAMGERTANVQVLDLGITDSNQTYLVANVARSSDMLDLVLETDNTPYVEPFFTDTLGTEIFGESRQAVPQTYEDDDAYYENLRYEDEPAEQGKLGTALAGGFAGLKSRFGKKNQQQVEETYEDSDEQYAEADYDESAYISDQTAPNAQIAATQATPVAPVQPEAPKPKVTRLDDDAEPSVTATAALAAAAQSKGQPAKEQPKKPEQQAAAPTAPKQEDKKKKKAAAVTAGAAGAAAATAAAAASKPSTFPAAAKNVPAAPAAAAAAAAVEEESTSKGTRLLVGAVLVIVLVIGVVFAFNFLGGAKDTTADSESTAPPAASAPAEESKPAEEPSDPSLPAPEISDISRLVPGNQALNAETDSTLSKMIDGNESSNYRSYTYTTPNFGKLASNMVFILELEDDSAIKEINLDGLNAIGGAYEILVGDSDDLGDAKSVAKGSFSGPSVSVNVKDGDKDYMEGKYVFLNVTELPRRTSGSNDSRPYGLQIGEFSAK